MGRDTESTHVTKIGLGTAGAIPEMLGWQPAIRKQSYPERVRLPTLHWLRSPSWVPLVTRDWQAYMDESLPVPLCSHFFVLARVKYLETSEDYR